MLYTVMRQILLSRRNANITLVMALAVSAAACLPGTKFDLEVTDVRIVEEIHFAESGSTAPGEREFMLITLLTTPKYYDLATASGGSPAGFILEPCDGSEGSVSSGFYVIQNNKFALLKNTARPATDSTGDGHVAEKNYYMIVTSNQIVVNNYLNGRTQIGSWRAYTGLDSTICIRGLIWTPLGTYARTETVPLPHYYSDIIIEFLEYSD